MKHALVFLLAALFADASYGQYVGIGTSHPQAKLHVAGTLRVDTATNFLTAKRVAVLDSVGLLHSYPIDSLKKQGIAVTMYSQQVAAQASTTSSSPQTRVTLTLPAGTYLLFAYFEVYNSGIDAGVRAWLYEGSAEIAYGIVYSNTSTFGSWSTFQSVSPAMTTDYTLDYSSWPSGSTSFVRRARIIALLIQ